MLRFCSTATFVALSLLCAGPLVQQAVASSPVAYVYVQTGSGINLYDAASNGALTLVKGSPFNTGGSWMEAENGKYMFTFDANNNIHTYSIDSNGGIGSQVAELYAGNYDGADCPGETNGFSLYKGILDHTGKSFYVQLYGYATDYTGAVSAVCSSYQYYQVGSNGKLTFNGAYSFNSQCCLGGQQGLTFTGSDKYVYNFNENLDPSSFLSFIRLSNGALEEVNDTFQAPPPPNHDSGYSYTWLPGIIDADPNGHAAVYGQFSVDSPSGGGTTAPVLVSYTVNASGDLTTSNTYAELPDVKITPVMLNFSPNGEYLAAGGLGAYNAGGIQLFHWNGSKPATAFGSPVTQSSQIEVIHWDNNDHLYGVSYLNELYVYTVSSSGVKAAPGSPYKFSGGLEGSGLIVRPL